jgi:hypothetical protein
VLVRPACAGLPNRDAEASAPPRETLLASPCVVRIDVHGSKDRAKDASPSRMRRNSCLRGVRELCGARVTTFPSSATFGHPLSSARRDPREDSREHGGPIEVLVLTTPREERRRPDNQDAFDRHDTWRNFLREGIAPFGLHAGSPTHAARTFPHGSGDRALDGHCKVTVRSPAGP